jgi:hypothetical protein
MGSPHVLLLDSQILWWVFLPIAVVMLLIALGRHYATLLIQVTPQSTRDQIQKTQLLRRSQRLRMHSHFLPEAAWAMRQRFLVSKALIKPVKPVASAEADGAAPAPEMPQQDPMVLHAPPP